MTSAHSRLWDVNANKADAFRFASQVSSALTVAFAVLTGAALLSGATGPAAGFVVTEVVTAVVTAVLWLAAGRYEKRFQRRRSR